MNDAELRKLALAATGGPWHRSVTGSLVMQSKTSTHTFAEPLFSTFEPRCPTESKTANAAYIAAANPQAVIELLDRLKEAEKSAQYWINLCAKELVTAVQPQEQS